MEYWLYPMIRTCNFSRRDIFYTLETFTNMPGLGDYFKDSETYQV